jgi:hypothetical protein
MKVLKMFEVAEALFRVGGGEHRFQLGIPVTVKNTSTGEEIRIVGIEVNETYKDVVHLYAENSIQALSPDNFEIVGPAPDAQ